MTTKKARIPVTLEPALYEWIVESAKEQGTSISQAIRDAVKWAHEWSATFEILSNGQIMEQLKKSQKIPKKKYVPFEEVKKSVYRNLK